MITLSETEFKTKIRSIMCSYDTYFRDMETMFDAGYCKGLRDSLSNVLDEFGIQYSTEFLYK